MSSSNASNIDLSPTVHGPAGGRRRSWRDRRAIWLAVPCLLLAACSSGPGTQQEFEEILTRDGSFTDDQAACIADAVFDEYGADEDALGKISAAPDIAFLDGEDGVPGFTDFLATTVAGCSPTGPVQG